MKPPRLIIAVVLLCLLFTTRSAAQSFNFTTIDVPCAACPGSIARATSAQGINLAGDIVGNFTAPYNTPISTNVGIDSPAYCPAAGSVACTKGSLNSKTIKLGAQIRPSRTSESERLYNIWRTGVRRLSSVQCVADQPILDELSAIRK